MERKGRKRLISPPDGILYQRSERGTENEDRHFIDYRAGFTMRELIPSLISFESGRIVIARAVSALLEE
jgi:hypothetical protein